MRLLKWLNKNLIHGCYPIEKEKQITTYLDKGKMQLSICTSGMVKIQRCKLDAS